MAKLASGREGAFALEVEADGLAALRAVGALPTPRVLGFAREQGEAALLLEYLPPAPPDRAAWSAFGEGLARLHLESARAASDYGYPRDNVIGRTPQPNAPCASWPAFFGSRRLGHQLALARADGQLPEASCAALEGLIAGLGQRLPERPPPSLLHGDLWSGNALPARIGGRLAIALIDPAVHRGDPWCDVAMMRLFGGFPPACHQAFAGALGEAEDPWRVSCYQLYHVLNHVHLFGAGYVGQAQRLIAELTR